VTKRIQVFLPLTLLRLNFSLLVSKGNFLKYTTSSNTTHSARKRGFILANILPSPIRHNHFLSPAILTSVHSAVSVLTLILKQPVPSLPLLSTPNSTTVTLSTTIFLSLKYNVNLLQHTMR